MYPEDLTSSRDAGGAGWRRSSLDYPLDRAQPRPYAIQISLNPAQIGDPAELGGPMLGDEKTEPAGELARLERIPIRGHADPAEKRGRQNAGDEIGIQADPAVPVVAVGGHYGGCQSAPSAIGSSKHRSIGSKVMITSLGSVELTNRMVYALPVGSIHAGLSVVLYWISVVPFGVV